LKIIDLDFPFPQEPAGAPGCVADTKRHADYFKPAKLETTYYHDPLESSDNDIETYDRWRYLFGS
jgi:hypothetical protein